MSGSNRFTTTHWTVVLAAKRLHDPGGSAAFTRLCERYYEPLYTYLLRRGQSADDAQDLTQGFIARLIDKEILRHADPARGRFRAFLLTALKHYAANEHTRATADKRGGTEPPVSLEAEAAEGRDRYEPQHDLTPERLYDRRWALAVLGRALATLRAEYRDNGREAFFDAVRANLTGDDDRVPYQELAERVGMTSSAVRVAVHRMRLRYRELVRTEVAETVDSDDAVEDELRYLRSALGR